MASTIRIKTTPKFLSEAVMVLLFENYLYHEQKHLNTCLQYSMKTNKWSLRNGTNETSKIISHFRTVSVLWLKNMPVCVV